MSKFAEELPRRIFLVCIVLLGLAGTFAYGALAYRFNLQPVPILKDLYKDVSEVLNPSDRVLDVQGGRTYGDPIDTPLPDAIAPGLLVVAGSTGKRVTSVRIITRSGDVVHEWRPVWDEIWPADEGNFPERPVEGMYLHGVAVLPDGSLVANFEHQSTFRLDPCGNILWKLDNLGHHSVHPATDGTVWVSAEDRSASEETKYPFHEAPLRSWTMQQIGVDGEILRTIRVIDVLFQNDLAGLLYLSSLSSGEPIVSGDTLHLNDVDVFPEGWESGVFSPGDLMMSLRNINTIAVVDGETLELKFLSVGRVVRHHDPDFLDGDRISVFDNRIQSLAPEAGPPHSRIVEMDARTGDAKTVVDGASEEMPFFTQIMGMHQRLANGNILVVPSGEGRVLEFTSDARLAWRYDNRVEPEENLRVFMAGVLPATMNEDFFRRIVAECETPQDR